MPAPLITVAYDNSTPRFVNGAGDQILLRGVNLLMTAPSSFGPLAQSMGLNFIRLVCNWNRFEATAPTGSGTNYGSYVHTLTASELAALDSFGTYFASQNIYMQVDFAQAGWSPYFGGSGVPSWYYTDARFTRNQNGGSGWAVANQSSAISAWWTDATEKPMAQTLYNAWASAMVTHVTGQSWSDHVVGWQIFNEPNPGGMGGSSVSKVTTMQTWLSTTVDAIRAVDTSRACFVMCRGGGQGYGTAIFTDAFGSIATMQSKKMAMEYHAYYTGKLPGKNATTSGQVGYKGPDNDDYYPNSNSTHNTVAGSSYSGTVTGQRAWLSVPLAKAAAIGLPMMHGEFGCRYDDPGRLTYQQQIQQVFDENNVSCTAWKLGSTPADSEGLVTNGALNDQGQSLAAWFKRTNFIIPGGGGSSGPTNVSPPSLGASSLVDGQVVGYTQGTWSGAVTVTDVFQLSADGSTGWATVGSASTFTIPNDSSDDTKYLRILETATDSLSQIATATSSVVGPIAPAGAVPVNTAPPTVDKTSARPADVVTWTGGTWTNTPTSLAYAIQRRQTGSGTIASTTSVSVLTYTVQNSDVGYDLRIQETATNGTGAGTPAVSAWTTILASVQQVVIPTITLSSPSQDLTVVAAQPSVYSVAGTVTSNTSITACFVNGASVSVDGSGNFFASIVLIDGPNTVTVVATDADGDTGIVTHTVTLVEPSQTGGGGSTDPVVIGSDILRIRRELSQRGLE